MPEHDPTPEPAADAAPGVLARIEDLVNTYGVEHDTEALADPAAIAAWFAGRDLLPAGAPVDDADVARTHAVREGLRALIARNNADGPPSPDDAARLAGLTALARELPLVLDPSADPAALVPAATGTVDAALARLLGDVAAAVTAGTWSRMKACRNDDCRWAYYDHSRNRSRAWCSMAYCGNRAKARAFRSRAQ
ncbi:CGNR zinc finger domain-containing protein [Yinghuangia seranimata]|uniref:CGNR zinc finger domain-containing protein n=1 Tax=Yinghuangia seranimata TaxID=408067 RepID=UPI00248D2C7D|nr:CGNR zinc finger domain-containing protein [Yinghuangia seranimata]MDI2126487.1 CGNR zinc finger domain-containing protein [Yinghuangia seranimata]